MERINPERFFRNVEKFMLISICVCSLLVLLISQNLMWMVSFFIGGFLGFINFRTTKKEGIDFIKKIKEIIIMSKKNSYHKEKKIFMTKIYLKLIAIGIIIWFFLKLSFNVVFILFGFSLVYCVLMLISLKFFLLNKKEII